MKHKFLMAVPILLVAAVVLMLISALFVVVPIDAKADSPYVSIQHIRNLLKVYGNTVFDTTTINVATAVSGNRLTLPAGTFFTFNDTTNITSIVPSATGQGRVIWLHNPSAGAVDTLVDGGNLRLASNFNGTVNDVIALIQVDTFWVELHRSAN